MRPFIFRVLWWAMSDPFKPGSNNNPFSEQKGQDPGAGTQAGKERERRIFEEEQARRRHEQEAFARASTQSQSGRSGSGAGSQQRAKNPSSSSGRKSAGSGASARKARTGGARSTGGQSSDSLIDGLVSVAGAVAGGYAANLLMPGNGAAMLIAALVAGGAAYAFRGPLKIVAGVAVVAGVGWVVLQNQSGDGNSAAGGGASIAGSAAASSPANPSPYSGATAAAPQAYSVMGVVDPLAPNLPQTTDANYIAWSCADIMRLFDLAIDGAQQLQGGVDPAYLLGSAPLMSIEPIDPTVAYSLQDFRLNAQPMVDMSCSFARSGGGAIDCLGYAPNKFLASREREIAGCLDSRGVSFDKVTRTEETDVSVASIADFYFVDGRYLGLIGTRYDYLGSREMISLTLAWPGQ